MLKNKMTRIIHRLNHLYKKLNVYLANTSWLMTERALTLLLGFFVTVILARHLGPENFGVLAYSLSIVGLFSIAGHMGLSGLLIRELVKYPSKTGETLGTAFLVKTAGYSLGFLFILVFTFISESIGSTEFWVSVILSFGILLRPFDVIDYWFQAKLQAKYSATAKMVALVLSSLIKFLLVYLGASIVSFAWVNLFQVAMTVVLLLLIYMSTSRTNVKSWVISMSKARELLKDSSLVFIGSIFAVVYLKIDQVMLRWLGEGHHDVGVYSVAVTISEAWYFVPAAIVSSFFPRLIKLKEADSHKYMLRLQQLFDLLFMMALTIALITTFIAEPLMELFFGSEYYGSADILVIHVWAALFVFMRTALSRWIIIESMFLFSVITQGAGAIANVVLNWYLIPEYGGTGAAVATLISYSFAAYISLLFSQRTQPLFRMMSKAIASPFRYIFLCKKLLS